MAALEVTVDDARLRAVMLVFVDELDSKLGEVLLEAGLVAEREMKEQIKILLAKDPTGALMRSVTTTLVSDGGGLATVHVAPNTPYAEIQNSGGVINARAGGALAIPIPGKVPRGMWPRDWPGELTLIRSKAGNALLAEVGRGGKVDPKYVLRKSVTIQGVGYVEATAEAANEEIAEVMAEGLERMLAAAGAE